MTDSDDMEISLLEGSQDCPSGHSSQDVLAGGISHDGEPEMTGSGSSPHPSKRKAKTRSSRLAKRPSENKVSAKAQGPPSAEVPVKLPMPKVDLKALFDYRFRKQQTCRKNRTPPDQKEATATKTPRWRPTIRPRYKLSREERRKRYRERGRRFSFAEKFYGRKRIPFRMECLYEQAAMKGFFKYIEQLKYEHHLKKSLTQLNAGDDLENECLELRKYKYLDDDGPLSPIEETEDDQNENSGDKEDIGARIVENSCFILSSNIPEKKKSKKRKSKKTKTLPGKVLPEVSYTEGFFLKWSCGNNYWKQLLLKATSHSSFKDKNSNGNCAS